MATRGRILLLGGTAVAAAALLGGAAAFACTNLATLGTTMSSGKVGTAITVAGTSFAAPSDGAPASPVEVHWNKVDGPVLTTLTPDANGAVSGSFTLPDASPGHYVVIATQLDDEGKPQFGTPARIAFEILGASGESTAPPAAQPVTATSSSSDDDSSVPLVLVGVLGVVSLGVFAAGLASFRKERAGRPAPAVAPAPGIEPEPEPEPAHKG
ncbi:MAG: hypothetical protein ACRD0S_07960 [Acidimicrobiales bacterium]